MREREYDRARREIRRLDSALNDYATLAPTLGAMNQPDWLSVLRSRSEMAYVAFKRMQVLPHTAGARFTPGTVANAGKAVVAIIDAFEILGLYWEPPASDSVCKTCLQSPCHPLCRSKLG